MGLIKSALELALERTEGLSVDKDELRRKDLFTQGRVAAAKSLEGGPEFLRSVLGERTKDLAAEELKIFREGVSDNLVSRLHLAFDAAALKDLESVATLLTVVTEGASQPIVESLGAMFQQYGQEFAQLKTAIGQQLGPQLRQRAQQAGANPATYQMERDPAYLKVLSENLEPLRAEYQQHLDEAKKQLHQLAGTS